MHVYTRFLHNKASKCKTQNQLQLTSKTYFTLVHCLADFGHPTLQDFGSIEYLCDLFYILYHLYLSLIFLAMIVLLQDGHNVNPGSPGALS